MSQTTEQTRALVRDAIDHILTGRLLDGFEKFYADDVVMSENGVADPERVGKEKNRAYETYFANNATFHDAGVGDIVVDGDKASIEWFMDFTFGGQRIQRRQIAVQTWKDGQIVKEVFYYAA